MLKWEAAERWTERERERVRGPSTVRVSTVEQLRNAINTVTLETNMSRPRHERYIYVPHKLNKSSDLVIRTATSEGGGKVSVVRLAPESMRGDLKERLWNTVTSRMRQDQHYRMSSEDDNPRADDAFRALHLGIWGRYLEKPKPGQSSQTYPGCMPGNRSQRLPYPSADLRALSIETEALSKDLGDVYAVIEAKIRQYFPDYVEDIEQTFDGLPDSDSPATPFFSGLVVNINARSRAHRDDGDLHICAVIPFGSFEGGELILYELGLVFELKTGDILIFESTSLTHFNMSYSGTRGSLVLHSDKSIKRFRTDKNGWGEYLN